MYMLPLIISKSPDLLYFRLQETELFNLLLCLIKTSQMQFSHFRGTKKKIEKKTPLQL